MDNNTEISKNGFLTIPYNIAFDDKLNSNDKLIYCYIYSLSKKYGYCFATNSHIANKFHLSRRTVQRTIEKLSNYKYIESDDSNKRKIYILNNNEISSDKICHTNYGKNDAPSDKNCHTPYDKNVTHNNIIYNNNYNKYNNRSNKSNFTQRDYSSWTEIDWMKLYANYSPQE